MPAAASIVTRIPGAVAREVRVRGHTLANARSLRAAAGSGTPVVCGPWLSEVGFEILYWIPMLRHELERHGITREQVVCVSRGGADPWYADLAARYVDALDHWSPEAVKASQAERISELGHQKQTLLTRAERDLLGKVTDSLGLDDFVLLHPRLMYDRFRFFWAGLGSAGRASRQLAFRPLPAPGAWEGPPDPGSGYVALKVYFSDNFPATSANRTRIRELIGRLSSQEPVVLLSSGVDIDEHEELEGGTDGGVIDARALMTPRTNLSVQTRLIAGAGRLVATYGGFSYLGPFLGVSSSSFYSEYTFSPRHLEIMRRAEKALGAATFSVAALEEGVP